MKEIFVTVLLQVDETVTVDDCKRFVIDAVDNAEGGITGEFKANIMKAGRHNEPRRLKQQKPKDIAWD